MDGPRFCIGGRHAPQGMMQHFENAMRSLGSVAYAGLPAPPHRAGYPGDVDVSQLRVANECDFFFFVDEWHGYLPKGLERLDCPTVAYIGDAVYDMRRARLYAPFFDHVFLSARHLVPELAKVHPSVHWLPYGCAPELYGGAPRERSYDVAHVGGATDPFRLEAFAVVERAAHERGWKTNDFRRYYLLPEMIDVYRSARIVFNRRAPSGINMRVWEAMAAGALLVTERDGGRGLDTLFEEGKHYVCFESLRDLPDVLQHWLDHPAERERIARAAQAEVLARQTYAHRVQDVVRIAREGASRAPARSYEAPKLARAMARAYCHLIMPEALRQHAAAQPTRRDFVGVLPDVVRGHYRSLRRLGWRRMLGP